jgi:hypothetical protein
MLYFQNKTIIYCLFYFYGNCFSIQPSPIAWQQMKQTGNVPTARSGHTIVTIKKTHYMFGGIDSPKDNPDKSKILPKN